MGAPVLKPRIRTDQCSRFCKQGGNVSSSPADAHAGEDSDRGTRTQPARRIRAVRASASELVAYMAQIDAPDARTEPA